MENILFTNILNDPSINKIFTIIKNEQKEIKLVGGCLRDTLLKRETKDFDLATSIEPIELIEILKNNNIQFDDFAIQYGSITAYPLNKKVQITSLREDINQSGRHTSVIYTKSWERDAARRDFTFNALYLGSDFKLLDFYQGYEDLKGKKIKFIGDTEDRIKEDYLRVYRYFRFLALFDLPLISTSDQKIVEKYVRESLGVLTNDVIRQEILKMFNMPYPLNCFFQTQQKQVKYKWVEIVKEHFIRINYELGLHKCLNKIDNIIN